MGWILDLSRAAAVISNSTSVPSCQRPALRYSAAVSWAVAGWRVMVVVRVRAASGLFEASQFSAMGGKPGGSTLFGAAEVAEHGGLQVLGTDVERIGVDRPIDEIQGSGHIAAGGCDLRQRKVP